MQNVTFMEHNSTENTNSKEHTNTLEIVNKLLENKSNTNQQTISYLLTRLECMYELENYESVLKDCEEILKISECETHVRIRYLKSLFLLDRHADAEHHLKEWLNFLKQEHPNSKDLQSFLETYYTVNECCTLDEWLENLDHYVPQKQKLPAVVCLYCNLTFPSKMDLRTHCETEEHELMVMSDEGRKWHWRAPPRGFKPDTYTMCETWNEAGICRLGIQCVEAHGKDELNEWRERFSYRENRILRAKEELFGKSYIEDLLEKWAQSPNPNSIMKDKVKNVEEISSTPLSATVASKNSKHEWRFVFRSMKPLKAVALLQDAHRSHFTITKITVGKVTCEIRNNQEWLTTNVLSDYKALMEYSVTVLFQTEIYGKFRQSVVFDFNTFPVIVKNLCVDVVPHTDLQRINDFHKELTLSIAERWTTANSTIVPYKFGTMDEMSDEWEKNLQKTYPFPNVNKFMLSKVTVTEKKFTRKNYRKRMHELMYVEEIERYNLIAQYNLTTKLLVIKSYFLSPNSTAASTAKYSSNGELFASMNLDKELSEDTSEGRLILMHCNTVYIKPKVPIGQQQKNKKPAQKVYEAVIEDKGKNIIYIRLSADLVEDLKLKVNLHFDVEVQFQLNRIPYCEWHYAIDKLPSFDKIFPDTKKTLNIPNVFNCPRANFFDSRLNIKQKEAIIAITMPNSLHLPPILVIGPFGTGKTFTLAQAIKELIRCDSNKILLCTHSNSAADLYIKDYMDVWVKNGIQAAKPLRIYYKNRWVTTVSPVVQKYCLIKQCGYKRNFELPTLKDIQNHKIIVVTLSTSIHLSTLGLPSGYFTHILVDEAAQAFECETISPFLLANDKTRIVLAGDHMQLEPDIFSRFCKDRNLHISLLERLFDFYPIEYSCKIMLCENYRSHKSIIDFTSESFYEQQLICKNNQPKHQTFYPLTFFTACGEDVQDKNSTAFYNISEIYEVVERIDELKRYWPDEWGEFNEHSIGVVTPYTDQVFRIRSELRKRRIDNVSVERVLNVQGKQFRVIILSTVRTRNTCIDSKTGEKQNSDFGFLSNTKLLNTAITRAQSLVAVIGDPVALCSVGKCSKVWGRFIDICYENNSLFGITWSQLKLQLDGIELKKIYSLNPLAPEFIPRDIHREQPPLQQVFTPLPCVKNPIPSFRQIPPTHIQPIQFVPILYPTPTSIPMARPTFVGPPPTPSPPVHLMMSPQVLISHAPQRPIAPVMQPIRPSSSNHLPVKIIVRPPKEQSQSNIQFMNNVHFPEIPSITNLNINECINLLPESMNLADMLKQPFSKKDKWYHYLKTNISTTAADKFKYLLDTTNHKGTIKYNNNIFDDFTIPIPSTSKNITFSSIGTQTIKTLSTFQENETPIYMKDVINGNGDFFSFPKLYEERLTPPIPLYERRPRNQVNIPSLSPSSTSSSSSLMNTLNTTISNGFQSEIEGGAYGYEKSDEIKRHINEEFDHSNLRNIDLNSINDVDGFFYVFRTYNPAQDETNNTGSPNSSTNDNNALSGSHFSKYFT